MTNNDQHTTITRADMRGFHKDYADVVTFAQLSGWTARRLSTGAIRLTSHDGQQTLRVPMTTKSSSSSVRRMRSLIARHASPTAALIAQAVVAEGVETSPTRIPALPIPTAEPKPARITSDGDGVPVTLCGRCAQPAHGDDPCPVPVESVQRVADVMADVLAEQIVGDTTGWQPTGIAAHVEGFTGRRPWLASRGTSGRYPSRAVDEVVQSGEVIGYGCQMCDVLHPDPHSIAAHYRRAHSLGLGRQEQADVIAPPTATAYEPSERLVNALADFIDARWSDDMDAQQVARAALLWMHDRPDLGDRDPSSREPLTAEQIVARIAALLDRRTDLADAQQRAAEAEQRAERLSFALNEREAEVERLTAEREALRDLLS